MERTERISQIVGPEHIDILRSRAERLAEIGASEDDIATELQIPLRRLRKQFRRELRRGVVRGKHHVLETLFDNARSGSNMAATALWVKAQCGWRDSGPASNPPAVIKNVLKIVTHPGPVAPNKV